MIRSSSQAIFRQKPIIKVIYLGLDEPAGTENTIVYKQIYRLQKRLNILFINIWFDYHTIDMQFIEGLPEELENYADHLTHFIYLSKEEL